MNTPVTVENQVSAALDEIVGFLFHTRHSRAAARLFLAWFISEGGSAQAGQISEFADRLAGGALGERMGRATFYQYVIPRFIEEGLIEVKATREGRSDRIANVYRYVTQPIRKRRPAKPSLIYNAQLKAEIWNSLFQAESPEDDEASDEQW